ncbi:MAG: SH3 domain-containing protein, partial [Candidatus Parcubacteria bacterium]|nr:SH3 domain-containing protein [Leptolyngbyaceae cyanobacterium LF-bin-113]
AANVRAAPDKNSKLITTLNNGQKVTVFEEPNGWIKVELDNGIKGWVANNLVR